MLKRDSNIRLSVGAAVVQFDGDSGKVTIFSPDGEQLVTFSPRVSIDALGGIDHATLSSHEYVDDDRGSGIDFTYDSDVWQSQVVSLRIVNGAVTLSARVHGTGHGIDRVRYLVGDGDGGANVIAERLYVPRFDWFDPQVKVPLASDESLGVQQWLSPPPLVYVFERKVDAVSMAVSPTTGAYNFQSFDYHGSADGAELSLTYEGHTSVDGAFETPWLVIALHDQGGNTAVAEAIAWQRGVGRLPTVEERTIPSWWREPIFCGWGQMRFDYRADHQGHENGNFINVTSYCTELRYRHYLDDLERAGISPGTVVIDMGWAQAAALGTPHPHRWSDMRSFIDEQHARGRRVLLWLGPVVSEGLPEGACMMLGGGAVAADPTSPQYLAILEREVGRMLGSGDGELDADGFKIDFTQCYPSESGRFASRVPNFAGLINEADSRYMYGRLGEGRDELIATHEPVWGIELVKTHIEALHRFAKAVKSDAMIMTHTAHPYFESCVDVLRLNDLDGECEDVLGVMSNRAELARASGPSWLIDTDDDLMVDKARWRAYAELQPRIGIPDTYYANGIAQSGESFDQRDYETLARVWSEYRNSLHRE